MMEPFTGLHGIAAPLARDNVDTDAIIPAGIFKSIGTDTARLGEGLFMGWREDPGFVLNDRRYAAAKILVTGRNFGCGSSREHAVWALLGAGIGCVIAESFADIFHANCFRSGLLPVALSPAALARITAAIADRADPSPLTVDLESCTVTIDATGEVIPFAVAPAQRDALLRGLDEIGVSLTFEADIAAFQTRDRLSRPWVYDVDFHEKAE